VPLKLGGALAVAPMLARKAKTATPPAMTSRRAHSLFRVVNLNLSISLLSVQTFER
jgi:hypothetical protein